MNNTTMNVVDYKKQLVYLLCGDRITSVERQIVRHELVRVEGDKRLGCAYCNTFGSAKRTRFICQHPDCQLPLCSVGSNTQNQDCFGLAHSSDDIRKALICCYVKMQQKTNNRPGTRRVRRDLNFMS